MPTPLPDRKRQIESLSPLYRGMARAQLAGATPATLADRFGLSPPRISEIIHSPLYQAELRRLEEMLVDATIDTVKTQMEGLRPRAVEVIAEELMTTSPSSRRTKCAFDLLDRTDFYPRRPADALPININQKVLVLSPRPGESLEEAKARMAEVRKVVGERAKEAAIDLKALEDLDDN